MSWEQKKWMQNQMEWKTWKFEVFIGTITSTQAAVLMASADSGN